MTETELIGFITVAASIVLIIAFLMRALNLRSLHKMITAAIDRGSPDTPALIDRMGQGPRINLRLIAFVLIAIATAILGVGVLEGNFGDIREALTSAMFPGFVGVAILLYLRRPDRAGDA